MLSNLLSEKFDISRRFGIINQSRSGEESVGELSVCVCGGNGGEGKLINLECNRFYSYLETMRDYQAGCFAFQAVRFFFFSFLFY